MMTLHAALRSITSRVALVAMLVLLTLGATAQSDRVITLGSPIVGQIEATAPVQVYTYTASAGEQISVGVTAEAGLALTLAITDSTGSLIASASPTALGEGVSLTNVTLSAGVNYVSVFPTAGITESTVGAFRMQVQGDGATTTTDPAATPDPAAATPQPTDPTPQPTIASVAYTVGNVITSSGLNVSLRWGSTADLNLELRDPTGQRLFFDNVTNDNGGQFGFDVNGLCQVLTADAPTETATYSPGAIPTGYYEVLVYYRQDCQNNGAQQFTLDINVDGVPVDSITGSLSAVDSGVYIASFLVNQDGTAQMSAARGVYGAVRSLPVAAADIVNAAPAGTLALDTPVRGTLAGDTYFQTYKFNGLTNDIVTLSMNRITGSLDTLLLVFDPNGQIIADNDDIVAGIVTDSAINNPALRLPVDGTYTVMVTRYGKNFGGTAGEYELLMTASTASIPQDVLDLGLPTGDVQVTLLWSTNADLQLLVRDPSGAAVFDDDLDIPSGGRMFSQGNVNCTIPLTTPVSHTYWPTRLGRGGNYEIEVWYQNECGDTRPVNATLYVSVYGQTIGTIPITPRPNERFVTSFSIDANNQASLGLGGILGGSETIDYSGRIATAIPLTPGQVVRGTISMENKFDVYTFEGTAGQVVTIDMLKTQGTLDTNLFLISPSNLEAARNDDAVAGVTDSRINAFTLPESGQYIIIATHYGTVYGATTGTYQLTLTQN